MTKDAELAREAERQRALLAAILAPQPPPVPAGWREAEVRARRGLGAYRVNARASAERALAASFSTLRTMLGEADFNALARAFFQQHPPLRGDLGEWGADLPGYIEQQAGLSAWPYLADCARLDRALHQCERAADAEFDAASLARLGDTDPALLRIEWMPGSALIESRWPLALIHAAHHLDAPQDSDAAFAAVREALQRSQAESVWVVRSGWRTTVHRVDAAALVWTRRALAGDDVGCALAAAGPGFDFSAWLAHAVASRWLKGIGVRID